ncbi:MAG: hypothetical protein U0457_09315 [Candidatus Sericytochromatia bacterium]
MNQDEININLDNSRLNFNLILYKSIKDIIKIKFTSNEIISLIEKVKLIIEDKSSFKEKYDNIFNSINNTKFSSTKKDKISELLENIILDDNSFDILNTALNLVRFKNFILEKSKIISENFRVSHDIHIMDFKYDYNMLSLPYSLRIAGALLIKILFENIEKADNSFYKIINNELLKIKDLDPDIILQIIYAESSSQSIRSTSGSTYESRFEEFIISKGIKYNSKLHDSKIKAVEYDFKLSVANKKVGVSVKRTLRERYKQNHEDIDKLDVDAMFLITLGIDLNEEKIKNITQKKGHFIFVANDIFELKKYMNRENKVFPINEMDKNLIKKILSGNEL